MPYRENLFTGKVTANVSAAQYLSVRYARNNNSQPHGAAPNSTVDNWGDSTNKFNSINAESQLGARRLEAERVHLPVRRFLQQHRLAQLGAQRDVPERR